MIFRIAAGLALNSAPEHRWRQIVVPLSATVFMLLLLAGTSVVTMVHNEAWRAEHRTALWTERPSPTDLLLRASVDAWRGENFPVIWIEPASGMEPVLPPGMESLPEPGQAVVSPALDELASGHPTLGARYPDRMVLGEKGVRSGDELFAYIRMPEGRTLAGADSKIPLDSVSRIGAFGPPSGASQFTSFDTQESVSIVPVVGGVAGLLIFPGLLISSVGLAAASEVRDRRFGVLRWVGAPGPTLVRLAMTEALILAVPVLVGVTLLWGAIAPQLLRVPLVGRDVVRGDLGIPWWLLLAELVAATVVIASLSVIVTAVSQHGRSRPRPGLQRAALTPLRVVPLVAALAAFAMAWNTGGALASDLNLAGILAAVAGVPLVLPRVLRPVGAAMGRSSSVPAYIVGRRLEWDPLRAARPFAGGAALLVLVLAGSGFVAVASYDESSAGSKREVQLAGIRWLDPRPGDTERLESALDVGTVVPTEENRGSLAIGATCAKLTGYFPGTECNPDAPFKAPSKMESGLAAGSFFGGPGVEAHLVSPREIQASGTALVLGESSKTFEKDVRSAAMSSLPAPYVFSAGSPVLQESPLVPWLVAGLALATVVLGVGCLVSLIDRLLGESKRHRHLVDLGLSPDYLVKLEIWKFLMPYFTTVALGSLVGGGICALMVELADVPVPWVAAGAVLGFAAVVGAFGAASMALFGARGFRGNPE